MNQVSFSNVLVCGLVLAAAAARAQPLTIYTLAGDAGRRSADGVGSNARFANPSGIAADSAGNLYVADAEHHTIRKIIPAGVVSTLAGLAGVGGSADGADGVARFQQPDGVAVDSAGNVYVADAGNHTIRKITPAGVVSTLAGSTGVSGSTDATGTNALFFTPRAVAVDAAGNVFVADTHNHTVRKITPAGTVSTFAGLAGNLGVTDGPGASARFYQPEGLAVDGDGNLYVADTGNHTVRKITPAGVVSTLAGSAGNWGSADATGTNARFYQPTGVTVDGDGNIFVADSGNHTLRRITPAGVVTTPAGSAGNYGAADGANAGARFWSPADVAVAVAGNVTVCVADIGNGTIRQVTASGADWVTSTLAGSAASGSADGQGTGARFYWPAGVAADSAGNLYVADTQNSTIRKISPSGAVSTFAGAAGNHGSADGFGINAQFHGPQGLAMDAADNLYVADTINATVRKISPAGYVSTLAGFAGNVGSADGAGNAARFDHPEGIAVSRDGIVYVADTWNHTIRRITPAGAVDTLAGLAGNFGSADGTNSRARFQWPAGLAVDSAGDIFVTDFLNHSIRRITPAGAVSTIAGMAGVWGRADGPGIAARFYGPRGIAVNDAGDLLVVDSGNQTIRLLTRSGTNWTVSTVAGRVGAGGSADGPGDNARFLHPAGLALDHEGYVYLADAGNNAIRTDRLVPPSLQYAVDGDQIVLSWPVSATALMLETAASLNPGAEWAEVTAGVAILGDHFVLTNALEKAAAFYRLRRP